MPPQPQHQDSAGGPPTPQPSVSPVNAVDRRALRSIAGQFFVNGAIAGSLFARFPEIRAQVGLSLPQWGALLSAVGAIGLLGSAIVSPLLARWTTRQVLEIGAAAQVLLIGAVGFAPRWWVMLAILGAISAIDVIVDVSMNLQGSWLNARRRVGVMNRLHGLWSVGALVGGAAAARLAAWSVGLRPHLLGLVVALLIAVAYIRRGLLTVDERSSREVSNAPKRRRTMPLTLTLFAMASAGAIAVEQVPNDWSAQRLSTDLGSLPGRAGLAFVAFTLGMTLARFSGDFIAARIGNYRLFILSAALTAAGIAAAGLIDTYRVVLAGFLVAGLGVAPFFPTVYDDAAQFPGRTGAALGALTAGSRGAGLILPSVVGALAATRLSVGQTITVVVLIALSGLVVVHTALRRLLAAA